MCTASVIVQVRLPLLTNFSVVFQKYVSLFDLEDDEINEDSSAASGAQPSFASLTDSPRRGEQECRTYDSSTATSAYVLRLHSQYLMDHTNLATPERAAAMEAAATELTRSPPCNLDTSFQSSTIACKGSMEDDTVISAITEHEHFELPRPRPANRYPGIDRIFSRDLLLEEDFDATILDSSDSRNGQSYESFGVEHDHSSSSGCCSVDPSRLLRERSLWRSAGDKLDSTLTKIMQVWLVFCPEEPPDDNKTVDSEPGTSAIPLTRGQHSYWYDDPTLATLSTHSSSSSTDEDDFLEEQSIDVMVRNKSEMRDLRRKQQEDIDRAFDPTHSPFETRATRSRPPLRGGARG